MRHLGLYKVYKNRHTQMEAAKQCLIKAGGMVMLSYEHRARLSERAYRALGRRGQATATPSAGEGGICTA